MFIEKDTIAKFGYSPSSVSQGSDKKIVFKCEFCLNEFVSSFKVVNKNKNHVVCKNCRSLAAGYTQTRLTTNKHEYYLKKRPAINTDIVDIEATISKYKYSPLELGAGSKKYVVAKCEFCLNKFETMLNVINNRSNFVACKKCDAVASVYSRFKSTEDKHQFYLQRRPALDFKNIDIEATRNKFGYSPEDLSIYSSKKIIAKCGYCFVHLEIPMSKFSVRKGRISCWSCMRKKTVETLKEKYGVECTLDIPEVRQKLANPKTEQIVESILVNRYKLDFVRNHSIGPFSFDFWIPSLNLIIECHGDFFRKFKENGYAGTPTDRSKSTYIEKYTNHKLIWIYEHEIHIGRLNKILDHHIYKVLEPEISVDLKKLEFKMISNKDAHVFLSQYHYLGNLGTVASSFGAYQNDVLLVVCVFGGVTRMQSIKKINKFCGNSSYGPKEIKELRRFCIRPNVITKNLASFSLKKFIDLYKEHDSGVKILISFSDQTVDDHGTIYKASNWKQMSDTHKSYHYLDSKTNKWIHKKTIWDMAKGSHMSENDFVSKTGLIRVDEMPKQVWIKNLY
jgi:hypothetical protein